MKPPYYRDIWILGPGNGYPGAFPSGLVERIKRRWWGTRRLWVCSGAFKDSSGITIDIKKDGHPMIQCNAETLPFRDSSFDFVLADPPYSEAEAQALYGLPYLSILDLMKEMARVCRPGGHVILLHRLIPMHDFRLPLAENWIVGIVGVATLANWSNIRALTVWRKPEQLELGGK